MKISKLHIESFRHLENLTFDFTYPNDFHEVEKRGKPLEKICIIGQSATGKTGLLELVKDIIKELYVITLDKEKGLYINMNPFSEKNKINYSVIKENKNYTYKHNKFWLNNVPYSEAKSYSGGANYILKNNDKLYYLKANIVSNKNINIISSDPFLLRESFNLLENKEIENILEFGEEISIKDWYSLLSETVDFHSKRYQKYNDLIGEGLISDLNAFNKKAQQFLKENPSPIEKMSLKFKAIFQKLGLEIDTNYTKQSIPVKNTRNDEVIPIQNTSTGTKQLLLTSLPLYKLETKDSIILIDEPERSLYPDIQLELMEHYQNLAPDAQFIVATHSPFIAAAFEPEERFILYFDEDGKVAVRRGNLPIGDDPNDNLYNDFGIDYINKFGKKAYKDYLDLKSKIKFEKDENTKNELLNKLENIGDKYNF
jgi:predicted ATP-dependent endonuclease of OLD family